MITLYFTLSKKKFINLYKAYDFFFIFVVQKNAMKKIFTIAHEYMNLDDMDIQLHSTNMSIINRIHS